MKLENSKEIERLSNVIEAYKKMLDMEHFSTEYKVMFGEQILQCKKEIEALKNN